MIADQQLKIRVSAEDKKMLKAVSQYFERSQSDTVKVMIRGLYKAIEAGKAKAKKQPAS